MAWHQIIVFLLGLYVFLESIVVAMDMNNGDRLCRWLKYLFTAISGSYAMYMAWKGYSIWQDIFWALAIALFVWPKMIKRTRGVAFIYRTWP